MSASDKYDDWVAEFLEKNQGQEGPEREQQQQVRAAATGRLLFVQLCQFRKLAC